MCHELDDRPAADARRSHRLNGRVELRQPRLVVADELPKLVMAPDLTGAGVVDHHFAWPHRFQVVTGAALQDTEVLRNRISLSTRPVRGPDHYDACGPRGAGPTSEGSAACR